MQIALTRDEYDRDIHNQLRGVLGWEGAERAARCQYPKPRGDAIRELRYRGVALDDLWAADGYTADDLDVIVDVLGQDVAGLLTAEALEARAAGLSLLSYRQRQAAGDQPDADDDDQVDAGDDDQAGDELGYCERWS
jgi:hypothetical protein